MALNYSPFGRLARLRFESKAREDAMNHSACIAEQLKSILSKDLDRLDLLGPSEAFLKRVKNAYRWDLLLKAKNVEILQRAVKVALNLAHKNKWPMIVDIDPYTI